jgi:hypothetical protein
VRAAAARWFLVVACLLLVAGCGTTAGTPTASAGSGTAATDAPAAPVRVTLGLYSGRQDPSWPLTEAEAAALDAALARLAGAVGEPPVGGLGYHGFTIERPAGTLVAFGGAVAPPGDGSRAYLADPARTIERLLLDTARTHVAGNELVEVERALAP